MAITLRYESRTQGRTIRAAIRREPDESFWDFDGGWSGTLADVPLSASPHPCGTFLHSGTAEIEQDGVYAVLYRESGSTVATRYLRVLGGTDGSPAEPAERPSDLADILLAVRERLVERGVFADTQVDLGDAEDAEPDAIEGKIFGRVCPLDTPADDGVVGGGRHQSTAQVPILVRAHVRKALDRSGLSRRSLAFPGGVIRGVARDIIDALQQFMPEDAAANCITCEPLRLASPAHPARFRRDGLWYRADIQFDTSHRIRLVSEGIEF